MLARILERLPCAIMQAWLAEQQPLTLIGHAFGNRVVRAFSSRYPNRVTVLSLEGSGHAILPEQTLTTRAWAASGPDMPHPLALFAGQQ